MDSENWKEPERGYLRDDESSLKKFNHAARNVLKSSTAAKKAVKIFAVLGVCMVISGINAVFIPNFYLGIIWLMVT